MATINFNIPNDKLPRIMAAMKGLYPIPEDENGTPLFTDGQWAKEMIRRLVIANVREWEQRLATAVAMTVIPRDNELLN